MTEQELTDITAAVHKTLEDRGLNIFMVVHTKTTDANKISSRVVVKGQEGQSANLLQTVWRALGYFFLHHYEHPISNVAAHFASGADVADCVMKTMIAASTLEAAPEGHLH